MRKLTTVLGILAVAFMAGISIWWFFVASFGDRQLAAFIDRSAESGVSVVIAARERSGYPFKVQWRLQGVTVSFASKEGAIESSLPDVRVVSDVLRPQRLTVAALEPQTVKWRPANGSPGRTYRVQSGSGVLEPNDAAPGWRLRAQLRGITWTVARSGGSGAAKEVSANVVLPLDRRAADFTVAVSQVQLPKEQVFGRTVETALVAGRIAPLPREVSPAGLAEWQRSGGALTISRSRIAFGALRARAEGTVALDPEMRPAGSMKLKVIDPRSVLAIASREGWIKPEQLGYAQIGMGLLSRPNARGQQELNTQLDMRQGGLWIGPVRFTSLPPLVPAP